MQNNDKKVLLRISNLKQYFPLKGGRFVKANDGISLDIYEGETFGLVGESGIGRDHGIEIIDHEEAADDLCDVEQRVLGQLARGVELGVLGILLRFGELGVLGLELIALLLQLVELGPA